jgi:hypothetical protein
MMRLLGLLAIGVVAFAGPASADPESIGAVNKLVNIAYGQPVESPKAQLNLSDQVYQNETLETEPDASLQVAFLDGTTVQLEGGSQLVLDQYVFDPATSGGSAALNFGAGVFRFVTGEMNHDGISLETSATTIGIRGTVLEIRVGTTGATVVDVIEGAILVHPKHGDKDVTVQKGQRATVAAAGEDAIVTPIPTDIDDTDQQIVATVASPPAPDPKPDPQPEPEPVGNHSGLSDGTNPGHSGSNNGGTGNPHGGGNKDGHGHGE